MNARLRAMLRLPSVLMSLSVLAAILVAALFGPWLAPFDPLALDQNAVNLGSGPVHWLGTDEFGRDILSRLLVGIRPTITVALGATLIAGSIGTALGIAAGYGPDWLGQVIMRAADVLLSVPPILLALIAIGFWTSGVASLTVVIGIIYIPHFVRIAQASTLQVAQQQFLMAEEIMGARTSRIVRTAILPNILSPLVVQATLTIASAILMESGLSFLGLGILPPQPSWGQMIGVARGYMAQNPMYIVWPSLCLAATILAINVIGDKLRDALDPRLHRQ